MTPANAGALGAAGLSRPRTSPEMVPFGPAMVKFCVCAEPGLNTMPGTVVGWRPSFLVMTTDIVRGTSHTVRV